MKEYCYTCEEWVVVEEVFIDDGHGDGYEETLCPNCGEVI